MTLRALLPIILRFGATVSVLAALGLALQKYVHVSLPQSPLVGSIVWSIAVIVIVLGSYWNSVAWRKFIERQQAKTAAILGGEPDQLRAVLKEVDRLLPQDPLAAQPALEDYSRPLRRRSGDKREELWQRARLHRSAARELERDLQEDLTACHHVLDRVHKMRAPESRMSALALEL